MSGMHMMVCPHDTASHPERWFLFAQYLSQHLGQSVHYEQSLDFEEFGSKMAAADIVYANPQHALLLFKNHDFLPLVRAENLYDEAVLVTCPECMTDALGFHGARVATVPNMLVTQVALRSLARSGIAPNELHPVNSWMSVVQALYNGHVRFGILYKDFYEGMSNLSRKQVRVVAETNEREIFHCFMLAPRHDHLLAELRNILLAMADDARGAKVLADLHMERLVAAEDEDLLSIRALHQ